ncbi:MAG TPA: DUF29 domain-containing protein [Bryobacteraceae bacterium]|nr:DUF29 domain-containing protein [Bryobacteraceae bacterium]
MIKQWEHAPVSYDADFYEWRLQTAELMRQGRFDQVDLQHVAEEIEDMGKRDEREVSSRLVLMMHLLKWQAQPNHRSKGRTIREQRLQLELVLNDSPSLIRIAGSQMPSLYRKAVKEASCETALAADHFSKECPYPLEQILDPDFLLAVSDAQHQ